MAKKKNSTVLTEEELIQRHDLYERSRRESHELLAERELYAWYKKWEHTNVGRAINNFMSGDKQTRGRAFDKMAILWAVTLLEKIGIKTPAAKKLVADRFCTSLRNVDLYLKEDGGRRHQVVNIIIPRLEEEIDLGYMTDTLRLTQEEARKINETIFREK